MNDSWGVILKKQTDASTDIVHGVKFVRPLHLSTYHVTMSTFILGDMYLDPDVTTTQDDGHLLVSYIASSFYSIAVTNFSEQ